MSIPDDTDIVLKSESMKTRLAISPLPTTLFLNENCATAAVALAIKATAATNVKVLLSKFIVFLFCCMTVMFWKSYRTRREILANDFYVLKMVIASSSSFDFKILF
jgi:hypothetical protein